MRTAGREGKPRAAGRVQEALEAAGLTCEVRLFPESTRTSQEAAAAIGCEVAQIAKSLIFKAADARSLLIVASGINRVDEKKVAQLLGQKIKRADPDFVRAMTGYAIGGVSPVAHRHPPLVLLDEELQGYDTIWAAAGTPNAVFQLRPQDLPLLTGGSFCDLRKA